MDFISQVSIRFLIDINSNGEQQVFVTSKGKKIAPAICYESLQPSHLANALEKGAEIYVSSVAKSANGVAKAFDYFPKVAQQHSIPVLMCNCLGLCDDFESVGNSAVWDKQGFLLGKLDSTDEGLLIFDTEKSSLQTFAI